MPTIRVSTFTSFTLTAEEELTGATLTYTQKCVIQNQISQLAETRVAMVPDPNNYASYIQEEANVKGQIQALQYLLDCSSAAELAVLELAQNQAASQAQ
jgi:hypothetical protein